MSWRQRCGHQWATQHGDPTNPAARTKYHVCVRAPNHQDDHRCGTCGATHTTA